MELAAQLGFELAHDAFVFSHSGDGAVHMNPRTITRRYSQLVQRLKIKTTFHKLRHYSATELIAGGVDVRTVAGRLGHGGGGATTLRVYAAWVSEADQRASSSLLDRLPRRPAGDPGVVGPDELFARNPFELTAMDLRAQILDGTLAAGAVLPTTAEIAERYGVAIGTANRALNQRDDVRPGQVLIGRHSRALHVEEHEVLVQEPANCGRGPWVQLLVDLDQQPPQGLLGLRVGVRTMPHGLLEIVALLGDRVPPDEHADLQRATAQLHDLAAGALAAGSGGHGASVRPVDTTSGTTTRQTRESGDSSGLVRRVELRGFEPLTP